MSRPALDRDAMVWCGDRSSLNQESFMRPFTRSIIDLFDGARRYLIPLYQRQYAWRVSPQLELLWDDIIRVADAMEVGGQNGAPHFMGAIVIAQMNVRTSGSSVRSHRWTTTTDNISNLTRGSSGYS